MVLPTLLNISLNGQLKYDGCATIDTEGMVFDTVMSVYDDCPAYGMEIDCNDDYY